VATEPCTPEGVEYVVHLRCVAGKWQAECQPPGAWKRIRLWNKHVAIEAKLVESSLRDPPAAPDLGDFNVDTDETAQKILEVLLDDGPLKASTLARKCNRSPSGSFRGVLAKLKKIGEVIVSNDGRYSLPLLLAQLFWLCQ